MNNLLYCISVSGNMKNQILKKPFRVAIEGNVGSGKSTLIKYFENFNNVEANPVSTNTVFIIIQYMKLFRNIFNGSEYGSYMTVIDYRQSCIY